MASTAHLMSCTRKGCTICDPELKSVTKSKEESDEYRIRTGYKRTRR